MPEWVADTARWRPVAVTALIIGVWFLWTLWSDADWFYQALFVFLTTALLLAASRPAWILNIMIVLLVGDVTGYVTELIAIPGLVGIGGVGGNAKIPELLSILAVFQIIVYFCLRPHEFGQPLVGNCFFFLAAGLIGTAVGLRSYISTNVLRDSLAYYFSVFYIIGVVLLPTAQAAKTSFRTFFYTAFLVLMYCYVVSAVTASTGSFYSATVGMFFSACAYFLVAKLFTSPPGTRRWLTMLILPLFSFAMFIGRSRGAVLSFLIGLMPLFLALPGRVKARVVLGLVLPCVLVMLGLFAIEYQRSQFEPFAGGDPGSRGIEAFTAMGSKEYDPTGNYRLVMWNMGWHGFLESPIFGKGYGWLIPLAARSGPMEEEMPASNLHNSFFHVLACGGLIGFLPLALFVFRFFALCWREYRCRDVPQHRLWPACAASIGLNFFLTGFTNVGFEQVASGLTGWLLVAFAVRMALSPVEEIEAVIPRRAVEVAIPRPVPVSRPIQVR